MQIWLKLKKQSNLFNSKRLKEKRYRENYNDFKKGKKCIVITFDFDKPLEKCQYSGFAQNSLVKPQKSK